MQSYQDLRTKWRRRLQEDEAACNFDLDKLTPGRFSVVLSDIGSSGACYSASEIVGFFEDATDFLGFLRFAEIPRVLDFDTGTNREPFADVADAYLVKYQGHARDKIDYLIGVIDRSLKSLMISTSELSIICDQFNETFDSTNPTVQLLAWGSLADVLPSGHFEEAFELGMEEETDEDQRPVTTLRNLLNCGEFDEGNDKHLSLAKNFLAQRVCA